MAFIYPFLSYTTVVASTYYVNKNAPYDEALLGSPCYLTNQTVSAGFYSLALNESAANHQFWPYYPPCLNL